MTIWSARQRSSACRELRRLVADTMTSDVVDDLVERVAQQRGEVRDLPLDVVLVRPDQPRHRDVPIVDLQRAALAEQRLGQDDDRALAQVVGARLEAEAEQADSLLAGVEHLVDRVSICIRLLGRIDEMTGSSTSISLARYCSARTSFGRHDPPNAKPGFR